MELKEQPDRKLATTKEPDNNTLVEGVLCFLKRNIPKEKMNKYNILVRYNKLVDDESEETEDRLSFVSYGTARDTSASLITLDKPVEVPEINPMIETMLIWYDMILGSFHMFSVRPDVVKNAYDE